MSDHPLTPASRRRGGPWIRILLAAAAAAGLSACDTPGDRFVVVTATVVDSAGTPVPEAHAELRPLDASGVVATADSAGRVRLELGATGPGTVTFGPGPSALREDPVSAPLLLGPGEVDLEVRLGGDSAGVVYPADAPVMARWGRAVALRRALEERYFSAYDAWVEAGQEGELDPGLAPFVDSVNALLGAERDPEVRAALWTAILSAGALGEAVSRDTAELILEELHPGAQVWAMDPYGAAGWVQYAADRAEGVDPDRVTEDGSDQAGRRALAHARAAAFLDRVVEANRDPHVGPRLLLGALRLANVTGRLDAATAYYERIVAEYPGTPEAEQAEAMAPAGRPAVGDPVPDVAFPSLDPGAPPIGPADLAGPATLVDFWAVWCVPCVAEIPNLRAAQTRFGGRGFRIVSVSVDESREAVRQFRASHSMPWTHAFVGARDLMGQGEVAGAYGITALPTSYLVGPDGRILALTHELRGERLAETLERVLPEG